MENLDELVLTRIVSFRDLIGAAMEIDERLLKTTSDSPTALAELERAWVMEGGRNSGTETAAKAEVPDLIKAEENELVNIETVQADSDEDPELNDGDSTYPK